MLRCIIAGCFRKSTGVEQNCRNILRSPSQGSSQNQVHGLLHTTVPSDCEIQLTGRAIQKLKELQALGENPTHLRLTVEAGGCSGFSYRFELDREARSGDRAYEAGGVNLVTDDVSLEFIRGAKIDYSDELIKSAFEVIDNPNADKGCGCGSSFSPK